MLSRPWFSLRPRSRPWRVQTLLAEGKCPGKGQKHRPRACPRWDGDRPEGGRGEGQAQRPQPSVGRRLSPAPQQEGSCPHHPPPPLSPERGLRHPRAQPRPPVASTGPTPPCTIDRILAGPRPPGARSRHILPAEVTHLRRRRHRLPVRTRLGPPQTPARASPAAAPGGAGPTPADGQSAAASRCLRPIRVVRFGWTRRKHSRGIPPPRPALPDSPPRREAVDRPAPPKPRRAVPTEG